MIKQLRMDDQNHGEIPPQFCTFCGHEQRIIGEEDGRIVSKCENPKCPGIKSSRPAKYVFREECQFFTCSNDPDGDVYCSEHKGGTGPLPASKQTSDECGRK